MERWLELAEILRGGPITERAAATAIMVAIERGRFSKAERPAADAMHDRLAAKIDEWRRQDRAQEAAE